MTQELPSTKPYLIRAIHEWCSDNGFTPYIVVVVDGSVRVPMEYVKDGEIVLNISYDATGSLSILNDYVAFKGRFGGVARDISFPVARVAAIYAKENGQGMAFPVEKVEVMGESEPVVEAETKSESKRPSLTRIK